jgi:hypothetical protein
VSGVRTGRRTTRRAPADDGTGKKTLEIRIEQDWEVKRLLEVAAKSGKADLEAWESALRVTVLAFGAKILAGMLAKHGSGRREEEVVCRCGQRMESRGVRGKEMMTILGSVPYERSLFTCPACRETRYPGDEVLDVYDAGPICFRRTRPWLQATGERPLTP